MSRSNPLVLKRIYFLNLAFKPGHATNLAAVPLLHGVPEFIAGLAPPGALSAAFAMNSNLPW